MIIQDHAVAHHHVALRVTSDVLLVRDHDNRNTALVELLKNSHDLHAGPAVQIAGRLVRKQHFGIVDQRARDRYALLLAAGKLARMMIFAPSESDRCKDAIGLFAKL